MILKSLAAARNRAAAVFLAVFALQLVAPAVANAAPAKAVTVFRDVRIFDGKTAKVSAPTAVRINGSLIETIGAKAIENIPADASVIEGGGRTLMPGLIDAHTHLLYTIIPQASVLTSDLGYLNVAATKAAREMLLRGFTTVRDVGGPVFGLKRGIDTGLTVGPRIWPSGLSISQTGGHGDFRMPNEVATLAHSHAETLGAVADSPEAVQLAVRQQLALGASQIKLMAGGGVSSPYDPLDVTQYSPAEMKTAVETAANWGTYVTVHAYTPAAVRQAIEAGVRSVEHGQLIDEQTAKLMAEKGTWIVLQAFLDDEDAVPFPSGSSQRAKQLMMIAGTDAAYRLARKYGLNIGWGSDTLFDQRLATRQGAQLTKLKRWFSPAEVLRMATSDNARMLTMSGLRSPYAGRMGVVEEGALADLLLVDGDPTANIDLIADPEKNFLVIMKDGAIYKNTLP